MTMGAMYIISQMLQETDKRLFDNISNLYVLLIDPYISGTVTLVTVLIRRRATLVTMKLHHDIDITLRKMNLNPPFLILTSLSWIVGFTILTGICTWTIHMYIIHDNFLNHTLWRMCAAPCYIMYNFYMAVFVGSMIFLYERFLLLNKTLLTATTSDDFGSISKLLSFASNLHFQLCETTEKDMKFVDVTIFSLTIKVYVMMVICVLSFYGMVPHIHLELTVWLSVYWIYFLLSVGLCELITFEVIIEFTFCSPKVIFMF